MSRNCFKIHPLHVEREREREREREPLAHVLEGRDLAPSILTVRYKTSTSSKKTLIDTIIFP